MAQCSRDMTSVMIHLFPGFTYARFTHTCTQTNQKSACKRSSNPMWTHDPQYVREVDKSPGDMIDVCISPQGQQPENGVHGNQLE